MNELVELERALASAKQSGKSPLVGEYERALGEHFGARHAISVNSGSAAIQAALTAVGAGPGRVVVASAAAPLPTLLPIIATGATVQFVDSRPGSPSIEPSALPVDLGSNVVAVVEVALWGYPQDYTELQASLSLRGIPLIEDAAQAHGARADNRSVGTVGLMGCFSTHEKKMLSTGEGGFILTNDAGADEAARRFARLGNLDGSSRGMNFKISAFTAAVGIARLERLGDIVRARRAQRDALLIALADLHLPEVSHVGEPNGYNLVLDLGDRAHHLAIHSALAAAGIKSDIVSYGYKAAYQHGLFAAETRVCPNAERLVRRLVQLPTDSPSVDAVAAAFRGVLGTAS